LSVVKEVLLLPLGKSCATSSCWIPPGSEGSKGRQL